MEIRRVDMTDRDDFAACYAIMRDAELHGRPDAPMYSEREGRVMFSRTDPAEEMTAYIGHDGGTAVAAGFTALSLLDNTDIAFLHCAVPPPLRRRGYGGAMLERLVEIAEAAERSVMLAESWLPPEDREAHPYRRFAERQGFKLANVEVRRVLPLPVPAEKLAAWASESARRHLGYRIETYVDDVPDRLLPSMCAVMNQLTLDAPTGDIELEEERLTPEAFRERRSIIRDQGRTVFTTLAVAAGDEVVAYTNLVVSEDQPEVVEQWGTLVHRDHRGHRLGMAVKAANLTAVQAAHPQGAVVNTCNAETNGPMLDINIAMGFEPVELLAEFQLLLAADRGVRRAAAAAVTV